MDTPFVVTLLALAEVRPLGIVRPGLIEHVPTVLGFGSWVLLPAPASTFV